MLHRRHVKIPFTYHSEGRNVSDKVVRMKVVGDLRKEKVDDPVVLVKRLYDLQQVVKKID